MKRIKEALTRHVYLALLGAVIIGLGVGVFAGISWHTNTHLAGGPVRQSFDTFVNPLLGFDVAEEISLEQYGSLKKDIETIIDTKKREGKVEEVSVYFKDPQNGKWFGIDENKGYFLGSLAKVPLLIAYAKSAERNEEILEQKIKINLERNFNELQSIQPAQSIQNGKSYSIAGLLAFMIQYSDNNASTILASIAQDELKDKIYEDFGIAKSFDRDTLVTPKQYLLFFRALYNSTYLGRIASSEALQLLSATDYKNGLVAGVPEGVTVAHKFGEYFDQGEDGQVIKRQLHDCGIIYKEDRPYGLCVMTEGSDTKDLESVISEISQAAYKGI